MPSGARGSLITLLALAACGVAGGQQQGGSSVQTQIDAAIRDGKAAVRLPKGVVRLAKGLRIVGATGLTVDGTGTTLVVAEHTGCAISFQGCRDVALKGVTVDYDPLPFTQGTIVARGPDKSWIEFEIHEGYPDLTEDYLVPYAHIFDRAQVYWKRGVPIVYSRRTLALSPRRGRIEVNPVHGFLDRVEAGDRIVLNKRSGTALAFNQCENVRVKGVTLLAGPGGLFARYMRGDNRFEYDIYPGPAPKGASQPRLMSTCADGFNIIGARRGPVLENSRFSLMGDDSVNLGGLMLLVVGAPSPTEILVAHPYGAKEPVPWLVEPGDSARRLLPGNYAIAGEAPIVSCRQEERASQDAMERVQAFWPRLKNAQVCVYRLVLGAPLNAVPGDALDIPATHGEHYRISNCEFRDFAGQMRLLSSHGLVENNLMLRTGGIQMEPHYVFWREAGWVEEITIRNNRLVDTGTLPECYAPSRAELGAISVCGRKEDPKSPQPFFAGNRRIIIEGNTIDGCPVAGIYVRCAEGVTIRNNALSHTNYVRAPDAGAAAGFDVKDPIDVRGLSGVSLEGNRVTHVGVLPKDAP